jgi:mono/diheme cytochrome c family protein
MWSFEKRNLSQSERLENSTMPSYAENLSDDQLQDLVAYLYGLIRPDEG